MGEQTLVGLQTDALIFAASGTLVYLWLVVVGAPFVRGLRTTLGAADPDDWAPGLAVALGLMFSVTVIPLAAIFLAATLAPALALVIITSRAAGPGAMCGVIVFAVRAAILGLPRIPPRVELALVASGISWNPDEQAAGFERAYRDYLLQPARQSDSAQPGPTTRRQPGPVLQHRHAYAARPRRGHRLGAKSW